MDEVEVDCDCGPVKNGDKGYDNEGAAVVNDKTERCQPCAINEETNSLLLVVLKTNLAQSLVALASELGD